MTIYEIKRRTEKTAPEFFKRETMKFFGQTLKDFKVHKIDNENYLITAPIKIRGKITGHTKRLFNTQTNELRLKQFKMLFNEQNKRYDKTQSN
jgi:hypothetical protein